MTRHASGLNAWIIQRLSAIYIVIFTVVVFIWGVQLDSLNYQTWYETLSLPLVSIFLLLFFIALFFHCWVGIRDIVIDYIHSTAIRLLVLSLLMFSLFSMTVWVMLILYMKQHL